MSLRHRAVHCSGRVTPESCHAAAAAAAAATELAAVDRQRQTRRVKWQDPATVSSAAHEQTETVQQPRRDLSPTSSQEDLNVFLTPSSSSGSLSCSSPKASSSDGFSSFQGTDSWVSPGNSYGEDGTRNNHMQQILSGGHGSSLSSGSDGGPLALLTAKLLSHTERMPPFKHTPGKFGDITQGEHVAQNDKASNLPVDEPPQHKEVDGIHPSIPPEPIEEYSGGSGNVPSRSMDLNAAVAASIKGQIDIASNMDDQRRSKETSQEMRVAGLSEDRSLTSSVSESCHREDNLITVFWNKNRTEYHDMALEHELVPAETGIAISGQTQGDAASDESTLSRSRITIPESESVPAIAESYIMNGPTDSLDRKSTELLQESCGNNRNKLALPKPSCQSQRFELSVDSDTTSSHEEHLQPELSCNSSRESSDDNQRQQVLEKVRRDKIMAKAFAYEEAKNAQFENRYKKQEVKILAREKQQVIKACLNMKKVEMKLETNRAIAFELMQNKIAKAHKKAEEQKATAKANLAAKASKAADEAEKMRTGKSAHGMCFPLMI